MFGVIAIDKSLFDEYRDLKKDDELSKMLNNSIGAKLESATLITTAYLFMIIGKIDEWFYSKIDKKSVIDRDILIKNLYLICTITFISWVCLKFMNRYGKKLKFKKV